MATRHINLCDGCSWLGIAAMIATFTCVTRSDYNLVLALTCYYTWSWTSKMRTPEQSALLITVILIISEIYDIAWLFLVWDSWTDGETNSSNWNNMVDLHDACIIASMCNMVVKIVAICRIQCEKKEILRQLKEKW